MIEIINLKLGINILLLLRHTK